MDNYNKIKFVETLSDFKREQIAKMFLFTHSFCVKEDGFKERWLRYGLPLPIGFNNTESLLSLFQDTSELCIQDDFKKLYVDALESLNSSVCVYANDAMMMLDRQMGDYRNLSSPNPKDMSKLLHQMYDAVVMINSWIFTFQMHASKDDLSFEKAKVFYPHVGFMSDFQNSESLVEAIKYVHDNKLESDSDIRVLALHSTIQVYMQLVSFTMLCALMLDAFCASIKYRRALIGIQRYIQIKYHNYYLYRVEIPTTSVDANKPVAQRGANDHTTLMKIFLFDRNRIPVLLRIDLPHSGSEFLHINQSTVKGEKLLCDHFEIECDQTAEEITPVLESLKKSMSLQTPNLFKQIDTNIRDEQQVFQEMQKFVDYNELCLKYLEKNDCTKELNKVAGFLGYREKPYDIKQVLTKAYMRFGGHPKE